MIGTPNGANTITVGSSVTIGNTVATTRSSVEKKCSYLIFLNASTAYAQNCQTGSIDYGGTDATKVINNAISALKEGGLIHMKPGIYLLSGQVVGSVSNVVFEGEGRSTDLQVNTGGPGSFQNTVFLISGSNWIIRNFQLDTNHTQGTGNAYYTLVTTGFNETISAMYIYNGDTCAINARGSRNVITNNYVSGMANDNICVWSNSAFSTDNVVSGNVVYNNPSSTITCYALEYVRNTTVTGNLGNGCGIGIAVENLGRGTSENISIVGNTLVNINGRTNADGIAIYPQYGGADSGQYITIKGNNVSDTKNLGISIDSGRYVTITNNSIGHSGSDGISVCASCREITISGNSISGVPAHHQGIYVYSGTTDFGIVGNAIDGGGVGHTGVTITGNSNFTLAENTVSGMVHNGIVVDASSNFVIAGNKIRSTATRFDAIYVTGSSHFTIEGNALIGSGVIGTNQWDGGIRIVGTSSAGTISSNTILGDVYGGIYLRNDVNQMNITGNTIQNATTGILEYGSPAPDYNTIAANYLVGCTTAITLIGTHDTVKGNIIE
jgi:parallel beta-helix repeat protein